MHRQLFQHHRTFGYHFVPALKARVEHDLVVISVLMENIRRVTARYRPYITPERQPLLLAKPYFTLGPSGALELHNVPVPREPLASEEVSREEGTHVDRGGAQEPPLLDALHTTEAANARIAERIAAPLCAVVEQRST